MAEQFPCGQCGAHLAYKPGSTVLKCDYCGHENPIAATQTQVVESDYHTALSSLEQKAQSQEATVLKCDTCAASITFDPAQSAGACPFCGSNTVTQTRATQLQPIAVLPFSVTRQSADAGYRSWISKRWFAPNSLKRLAKLENALSGVYLPHWTFDAKTQSAYRGKRGDDYTENVVVMANIKGKSVRQNRRVTRTRWTSASGQVREDFDDTLAGGSPTLSEGEVQGLSPWDMSALKPYDPSYLSGFRSEVYRIGLGDAFERAKASMGRIIHRAICRDIGGDRQQVTSVNTSYSDITFKHILLPVWIAAYRYGGKTYRVLVNAQTGKVHGQWPLSWVKAIGAIVGAIVLLVGAYYLADTYGLLDHKGK